MINSYLPEIRPTSRADVVRTVETSGDGGQDVASPLEVVLRDSGEERSIGCLRSSGDRGERAAAHRCDVEELTSLVIRVRFVAGLPVRDQIVGDALHGLSGDAEPSGGRGHGPAAVGDDAEQLPASLGLTVTVRDLLAIAPQEAAQFEDVGDEQCETLARGCAAARSPSSRVW